MIINFADKDTERLFRWGKNSKFGVIERRALRKLELLDAVTSLQQLTKIPGLKLHKLRGFREGQYAISINDQFRICFFWGSDNHAYKVEIVDYH